MYDFDFLKKHRERILVYKDIPLPVIIASKDLEVLWSNDHAELYYPNLAHTQGLVRAFMEYNFTELLGAAQAEGSCIVNEFVPMGNVGLKIIPLREGSALVGAVLVLLRTDSVIDAGTFYQSSRMPGIISDNIRDVVSEMFAVLDKTSLRSDLMQMGWIKPGLNELANNGYRILRIATNITEYARYQSELLDFAPRLVCLSSFLWEAAGEISRLAELVGTPISFRVPRKDFFAQIDITRFEHAFFNILHNAMYYTKPGNSIVVSLRANKTRDFATLSVADKGLGIHKDVLSKVTRPYYAHAPGRARRGVGLGLTIASLAAETHEGRLKVGSREDQGTTVRLILPLDKGGSSTATLAQESSDFRFRDRFSSAFIGLSDVALSPFNTWE